MLLLIIFVIIAALSIFLFRYFFDEPMGCYLIPTCVGIYVFLAIGLRNGFIYKHNLDVTEYGYLDIVSLNQGQGFEIHGDFVLGCGSIDGATEDYYITYAKFNNGLKRIRVNAYDTYLLRSDIEIPKIKNYYKRTIYKPFKSIWFWGRKKESKSCWYINDKDLQMVVPINTVKTEGKFIIDH